MILYCTVAAGKKNQKISRQLASKLDFFGQKNRSSEPSMWRLGFVAVASALPQMLLPVGQEDEADVRSVNDALRNQNAELKAKLAAAEAAAALSKGSAQAAGYAAAMDQPAARAEGTMEGAVQPAGGSAPITSPAAGRSPPGTRTGSGRGRPPPGAS